MTGSRSNTVELREALSQELKEYREAHEDLTQLLNNAEEKDKQDILGKIKSTNEAIAIFDKNLKNLLDNASGNAVNNQPDTRSTEEIINSANELLAAASKVENARLAAATVTAEAEATTKTDTNPQATAELDTNPSSTDEQSDVSGNDDNEYNTEDEYLLPDDPNEKPVASQLAKAATPAEADAAKAKAAIDVETETKVSKAEAKEAKVKAAAEAKAAKAEAKAAKAEAKTKAAAEAKAAKAAKAEAKAKAAAEAEAAQAKASDEAKAKPAKDLETDFNTLISTLRNLKPHPDTPAKTRFSVSRFFIDKSITISEQIEVLAHLYEIWKISPNKLGKKAGLDNLKDVIDKIELKLMAEFNHDEKEANILSKTVRDLKITLGALGTFAQAIVAKRVVQASEILTDDTGYRKGMDAWLQTNNKPIPTDNQPTQQGVGQLTSVNPEDDRPRPHAPVAKNEYKGVQISVIALPSFENMEAEAIIASRVDDKNVTRTVIERVPPDLMLPPKPKLTGEIISNHHYDDGFPSDAMIKLAKSSVDEQYNRNPGGKIIISAGNQLGPAYVHAVRIYCESQHIDVKDRSEWRKFVDSKIKSSDCNELLQRLKKDPVYYGYQGRRELEDTAEEAGVKINRPRGGG